MRESDIFEKHWKDDSMLSENRLVAKELPNRVEFICSSNILDKAFEYLLCYNVKVSCHRSAICKNFTICKTLIVQIKCIRTLCTNVTLIRSKMFKPIEMGQ